MAIPVLFEPGSILSRRSGVEGFSTSRLRMTVKGWSRKTAAFPFSNSNRARRGVVGASGFLVVSKTGTFMLVKESFDSGLTLPSGNVSLDKVMFVFCRFVLAVPVALADYPWQPV